MEIAELSIASAAAVAALAVELWSVSGALSDRGSALCLSQTSTPPQRLHTPQKPCIAQVLSANATGQQRLALYLKVNCPGERTQAMMARRDRRVHITLSEPWPTCAAVLGS